MPSPTARQPDTRERAAADRNGGGATDGTAAAGLEGVVAAETALGDVRGDEGFYHYRQYPAVGLARRRSLEDVWHLMVEGWLPDRPASEAFAARVAGLRPLPPGTAELLPAVARRGTPMEILHTGISLAGAELGWPPVHDAGPGEVRGESLRLCAMLPTLLAAAHRLARGTRPLDPRPDLSLAADYLRMLHGTEPPAAAARALEQYLVLVIDHGFNASTFAARVIASTGTDLASAICGAVGALAGPLHGGAPSRALDMLDEIGTPDRAGPWLRDALDRGDRIMGFGHRVYRTEDPRAVFLREVAATLDPPLARFAAEVERSAVAVLAEHRPGRRLLTNVELYAGVVLQGCGVPRALFTPTFAVGRSIGWSAHVLEQVATGRLIRPLARYVGPAPPAEVPAL
jgi:citrate synthase